MIPVTGEVPSTLADRFEERWVSRGWSRRGDRLIVACSGGVDSLTLAHLLRFAAPRIEGELEVAYFDHRMRPEGAEEALWLRGVAGSWGIPFHPGRAEVQPLNEEEARKARYHFLNRLLEEGARWILTAHHEDDQVETILFRFLRGTGIEGLRGIPEVRSPGILRPLLTFSRREIEEYAEAAHLRPRSDRTNRSLQPARNRVRHLLLPALQEAHPGAREGILRMGRHAVSTSAVIDHLLSPIEEEVVIHSGQGWIAIDREKFLGLNGSTGNELLRRLVGSLGGRMNETGTAIALEFLRRGASGKAVHLGDGISIGREFGTVTVRRGSESSSRQTGADSEEGTAVEIPGVGEGSGSLLLNGRRIEVRWGAPTSARSWSWVGLEPGELHFPLTLRGWQPGDRMRTAGGEKKLKRLFLELRVPLHDRAHIPLVADASGQVVALPERPEVRTGVADDSDHPRWGVGVRRSEEGE